MTYPTACSPKSWVESGSPMNRVFERNAIETNTPNLFLGSCRVFAAKRLIARFTTIVQKGTSR